MPFGIPPTHARAVAAGDYASASSQEVAELVAAIVTPIGEQIEAIEQAVGVYTRAVGKALKKHTGSVSKEVSDISESIADMIGYASQETANYVAQLSALAVQAATDAGNARLPEAEEDGTPVQAAKAGEDAQAPPTPAEVDRCFTSPPEPPPPPPPPPYAPPQVPQLNLLLCPQVPAALAGLAKPPGSCEWCESMELCLDVLGKLGGLIAEWLDTNIEPCHWAGIVDTYRQQFKGGGVLDSVAFGVLDAVRRILDVGQTIKDVLSDLVKCLWYYTQTFTPSLNPPAYLGLQLLKFLVNAVQGSVWGSQSYLGFTLTPGHVADQLERWIDQALRYISAQEIPSYPEVAEAWARGFIGTPHRDCLLRLHGLQPEMYDTFIRARGEQLSIRDAIQWQRRNGLSRDELFELLRHAGVIEPVVGAALDGLYDELPTVADHLQWLRKGIFIPGYVEKYHLDDGFDQFYTGQVKADLHAQGFTEYRAQQDYRAHWIQPSPQQLQEFVYRLRAGKKGVTTPFDVEDYKRILVEQEYAPLAREWFAQTVYKVPALSYLRDMYRSGVIGPKEIGGYHADLGYSPDDSERFVQLDAKLKARQNARMGSGWSPSAIRRAVSVGAMPPSAVAPLLAEQGFAADVAAQLIQRAKSDLQYRVVSRALSTELSSSVNTVRQSQSVGVMSESDAAAALTKLGFPAERAAGIAALTAASARVSRVKGAVQRIRHAFESGEIDADFARQALLSLKLVSGAIDDYLAVWRIEMTPRRRRLSASQVVQEVVAGAIDVSEAHVRLSNLGYDEADQSLLLADAARLTVTTPEALAQLALERGSGAVAGLNELNNTLIGLSKKVVAELMRQEPPAKLGKWLAGGVKGVTSEYVHKRLRLYGWDESSIEKWIAEYEPEEETPPEGGVP